MYYKDKINYLFGDKIDDPELLDTVQPHPYKQKIFVADIADYRENPSKDDIKKFQGLLREVCAYNQKYIDLLSGDDLKSDAQLHHHLVTRSMVVYNKKGFLIHNTYNCLMLNRDTHLDSGDASNRLKGAVILEKLYGSYPSTWYYAFPGSDRFNRDL
jgi:hypothetical protein